MANQSLTSLKNQSLKTKRISFNQLTSGKKVTRHGFPVHDIHDIHDIPSPHSQSNTPGQRT